MSWRGMELEPAAKNEWLKALRSGNYQQATHVLCRLRDDQYSYCCLGVLANYNDIPFLDDDVVTIDRGEDNSRIMGFNGYEAETMLPDDWFTKFIVDLNDRDKDKLERETHDLQAHLADMNDTGKSFSEIADWIEENL